MQHSRAEVPDQAFAAPAAEVVGTFFDLAEKRTLLKRARSVPLGRPKPKLMSEMAFSHSVSPSGPATAAPASAVRFSLLRCPFVVLRFCNMMVTNVLSVWQRREWCSCGPVSAARGNEPESD